MIEAHTGIEIGDHDPGRAGRHIPRRDGVDRRGLRALQVPLLVKQPIIGCSERVPALIDLGVLGFRIGAQPRERLRRALSGAGCDTQQVYP